jgi:16S rRNA (uracil1498-N3)-methyltransferase
MLQSQQVWLPVLHEPTSFNKYIAKQSDDEKCFIAHCENDVKQQLLKYQIDKLSNCQICIGPEGDFTKEEIELAIKKEFLPVSLGETRLRTETAGVAAAALLCLIR